MEKQNDKDAIERREKEHDREDGPAPVSEGGNPSPNGQEEPRNADISKQTI